MSNNEEVSPLLACTADNPITEQPNWAIFLG
jgi:hypothetical protein